MSVYSVNVYPSSTTIKTGNWYYGAYAIVNASSNCCTDVEWYSDSPSVASVNKSYGYIYGIKPGTAKIYAQSTIDGSKKDYITVTVTSGTICVDSVTLNRSSISLEKGDRFTLSATVCPTNASNKSICWSSTNPSVATVSGGVVTAKARGYTYIYAEAQDGSGEYDSCYVNVTEDILVTSVTVSPSSKTMNIGASTYLYETVCPTDATNKCVKWSSDKTGVATVNPDTGLVIAQGAGKAIITATAQDGSDKEGSCTITVKDPIPVQGIDICCETITMNVGEATYLSYDIYPADATNKSVTWCSSNENVATVGLYTGKVTAKKAGTTTITATTVDGGFQDCITVNVNYCGGSNYRDVTKHNMVLQSDGYYVCTRCGYRVKSPELEDKDVLSLSDYLQVVSAELLYTHYEHVLRAQFPGITNEVHERINQLISSIRRKSAYTNKYSYSDSSGKCHGANTIDDYPMWIGIQSLSFIDKLEYTGVFELFNDLIIGYYAPKISLIKDITDVLTEQINPIDFSALAAEIYGLDNISTGLSVASAAVDFLNSEIQVGDYLVKVNAGPFYGRYIFSTSGKLKMVKIVSAYG